MLCSGSFVSFRFVLEGGGLCLLSSNNDDLLCLKHGVFTFANPLIKVERTGGRPEPSVPIHASCFPVPTGVL